VFLPDKLIQRARSHAIGEWTGLVDGLVSGRDVLEKVHRDMGKGSLRWHGETRYLILFLCDLCAPGGENSSSLSANFIQHH
jgi:hypothetical protein